MRTAHPAVDALAERASSAVRSLAERVRREAPRSAVGDGAY
jgi:hypothetical protein